VLKEKKAKATNKLGEYYEARRKALIELGAARKRLHLPKKDKNKGT